MRFVKGSNDLEMYVEPALWCDPEVLAVADKLDAYVLASRPEYAEKVKAHPHMTRVDIKLKDGRTLTGEQEDARGSDGERGWAGRV